MDSRFRGNDDYLTTADGTSDYDHNRVRAAVTAVGGAGTQHLAARHACPHAVRLYWVSALPAPALPEIDHYEERDRGEYYDCNGDIHSDRPLGGDRRWKDCASDIRLDLSTARSG
jgi:hypothetical protein